jgi:hypothetical protein
MMIALHHLRPACPQREKGAKTVRRYRQAVRAYTDNANRKAEIAKSHADGQPPLPSRRLDGFPQRS